MRIPDIDVEERPQEVAEGIKRIIPWRIAG